MRKFAEKKLAQRYNQAAAQASAHELILCEEPLEIRVQGDALVTTMRTPGDDHKLALGFLFAEGLIHSANDLLTITHCGKLGDEGYGNVLEITPAHNIELQPRLSQRGTISTSSCGVCGRKSVQDLLSNCGSVARDGKLSPEIISNAPETLKKFQRAFSQTGGSHAALAITQTGEPLCCYEDIGRHNAVDKVIGSLLLDSKLSEAFVLIVSGRVSFEIIQKAAVAKIPVVASVSAPSTLAIDLATAANITLAAFVRDGNFTLYSHPERVSGE
jgi:FdhD protein